MLARRPFVFLLFPKSCIIPSSNNSSINLVTVGMLYPISLLRLGMVFFPLIVKDFSKAFFRLRVLKADNGILSVCSKNNEILTIVNDKIFLQMYTFSMTIKSLTIFKNLFYKNIFLNKIYYYLCAVGLNILS